MYFLIYKITNTLDGKIYIGKHKTKNRDDKYFGSGRWLHRAFKKHGKENFTREILFELSSEEEMNLKEKEVVTVEFCARRDTYNILVGGSGGWSYVNARGLGVPVITKENAAAFSRRGNLRKQELIETDPEWLEAYSQKLTASLRGIKNFLGKHHRADSIAKMSKTHKGLQVGERNGNFGKPRSEEVRRKISNTLKQRSAERRQDAMI